jgi:hypothetical protein
LRKRLRLLGELVRGTLDIGAVQIAAVENKPTDPARFLRPMPTKPQRQFERQDQKLAAPAKPKEKPAELKRPA